MIWQPWIHFEGKGGEIKSFTNETLAKMLDVRRQWLNMSAPYKNFTDVAKEFLKLIDNSSNFYLDGINGAYGYHTLCYRYFTDINKVQRAKIAFANSSIQCTLKNAPTKKISKIQTQQLKSPEQHAVLLDKKVVVHVDHLTYYLRYV